MTAHTSAHASDPVAPELVEFRRGRRLDQRELSGGTAHGRKAGGVLPVSAASGRRRFPLWKQRVVDKGWGTPGYPAEYGGAGLSTEQTRIVLKAFVENGAYNPVQGMGTDVGPDVA